VLLCGRFCLLAFCDVFERKEMIDVSRTVVELKYFLFSNLYFLTAVFGSLHVLSFHDFFVLFFLFLVRCFSCIFPGYLGFAFRF
jgi:hypothetical protein